jgi:hypothetical protein
MRDAKFRNSLATSPCCMTSGLSLFPRRNAGKIEVGPIPSRHRTEEMNGQVARTWVCHSSWQAVVWGYRNVMNDPITDERKGRRNHPNLLSIPFRRLLVEGVA